MALRPLKPLLPTADDVVNSDLPILGRILLMHLKSLEGQGSPVYQQVDGINREYFFAMMERRNIGLGPLPSNEPEYGDRQPEVMRAMREAWNWLEREGYLMRTPEQPSPEWFSLSRKGEELLSQSVLMDEVDKLLSESREARRDGAWWGRAKNLIERWDPSKSPEAKAAADLFLLHLHSIGKDALERHRGENQMLALLNEAKQSLLNGGVRAVNISSTSGELTLIAEGRLDDLRALRSSDFDFSKLIRLCEELNINSREDCHIATAMLTRGILDHVPPLFGQNTFKEVANNYAGGGRSFKDSMQHLESGARKIADAHLHNPIRKSETLPAAQQVNFAPYLDVLLSEIIRITK